jgi:hypothetical protein
MAKLAAPPLGGEAKVAKGKAASSNASKCRRGRRSMGISLGLNEEM